MQEDPPSLDPTLCGWAEDRDNSLLPIQKSDFFFACPTSLYLYLLLFLRVFLIGFYFQISFFAEDLISPLSS